jgi:cytochrome c553
MAERLPRHISRLLLLMGVGLLVAYAVKAHLTDPSYYRFGYYRADAVPELAEGDLRYLGSPYCQAECHEQRYEDWPLGAHKTVQCEVCHGPAPEHPDDGRLLVPTDSIRLCSTCHESMPARPDAQPQIILNAHPVDDGQVMPCLECHDPHSPGPVLRDDGVADATAAPEFGVPGSAIPESARKCTKCHGQEGEGVKKNPPLAGIAAARFVERMQLFREGGGDSKIMTRFAKSLSDAEIAGLAIYYEQLGADQRATLEETTTNPPEAGTERLDD